MTESSIDARLAKIWKTPPGLYARLGCVDHKIIGMRYLVTAMIFLILGGGEALLMRLQLARPSGTVLSAETYSQMFSMHGITMMFLFALPVLSGFSNYLWPLMLGARDMALPRLNAFSYWLYLFAGLLLYSSVPLGLAPDAGWFSYVPLASRNYLPRSGADFYSLTLILVGLSTTVGAINFIVTFARLRAPGMTISRVPILMWGTLTASTAALFAVPALTVACLFLFLDRHVGTHFFTVEGGGQPLLWQQLFWIFGHPWVYVVVLPAMGFASQIIPTFCRRPLVAYKYVVGSTIAVAVIGFMVWVHHMFATGISMTVMAVFGSASLVIALPSAVSMFAWVATIWTGRPVFRTAFLFMLGFLITFVMGGVSGVMTGSVPLDWQLNDSYFVVGHLHYVLLGINLFPVIGALYYWFPKATGRMMSERIGKISFWIMFSGFNIGFFPMHIVGMLGMPRRIYSYTPGSGWAGWNLLITIGAFIFAIGLLLTGFNVLRSWRSGMVADSNPWDASTLEWSIPSPPPPNNFTFIPKVANREPLWESPAEPVRSVLDKGPTLETGRLLVVTTARNAEIIGTLNVVGKSCLPLYTALAIFTVLECALWRQWALGILAIAALLTAVACWLWPRRNTDREHGHPMDLHPIGQWAMALTIATEAALFVVLIFAWFFLGHESIAWSRHTAPALLRPGINTLMLLASSAVLHRGGRQLRAGNSRPARLATLATISLGAVFLGIQGIEYANGTTSISGDAYGSAFVAITGLHALHVVIGLLMLGFVLVRTWNDKKPDHQRLANVTMYWHFVDVVWVCVFSALYVIPHI